MCLPYPLPSHRPACGCQESRFLTVPAPHAYACLCTCQGRSLFRPLGSPGGTGGGFTSYIERNNFILRATSCRSNADAPHRRAAKPTVRVQGLGWTPSHVLSTAVR